MYASVLYARKTILLMFTEESIFSEWPSRGTQPGGSLYGVNSLSKGFGEIRFGIERGTKQR